MPNDIAPKRFPLAPQVETVLIYRPDAYGCNVTAGRPIWTEGLIITMKRLKRGLAALLCTALLCGMTAGTGGLASAEEAPVLIAEEGSGEKAEELVKESEKEVWLPVDTVPADASGLDVGGKSAILIDQGTGTILFEKNAHEKLAIASVTKIMTLLLVMEALDNGRITMDEKVTCSATAASMGGSQIWLEQGEIMTVNELLKAAVIVSANDACAALAEHISGSIEAFVAQMNERAAELGMKDTKFLDCSGLSDDAYSSAYDVAVMSRELMKHKKITEYTTVWMDSLRGGKSQLVNTNKLVRHYTGATGLKTGTTSKAGHCLSATAERDGIAFVAVILGCATTDERFGGARKMLDFGFANYVNHTPKVDAALIKPVKVIHGVQAQVKPVADLPEALLIKKGQEKDIACKVEMAADLEAPVYKGQVIGSIVLTMKGEELERYDIRAAEAVGRLGFAAALARLWKALIA